MTGSEPKLDREQTRFTYKLPQFSDTFLKLICWIKQRKGLKASANICSFVWNFSEFFTMDWLACGKLDKRAGAFVRSHRFRTQSKIQLSLRRLRCRRKRWKILISICIRESLIETLCSNGKKADDNEKKCLRVVLLRQRRKRFYNRCFLYKRRSSEHIKHHNSLCLHDHRTD